MQTIDILRTCYSVYMYQHVLTTTCCLQGVVHELVLPHVVPPQAAGQRRHPPVVHDLPSRPQLHATSHSRAHSGARQLGEQDSIQGRHRVRGGDLQVREPVSIICNLLFLCSSLSLRIFVNKLFYYVHNINVKSSFSIINRRVL